MKINDIFSAPTRTVKLLELEAADIAALNGANGIVLLPAQGDDRIIKLYACYLVLDAGTVAFAGGGTLELRRGTTVIDSDTATDAIAGTTDAIYEFDVAELNAQITDVNENINLKAGAAVTGGTDGVIKVRIEYDVVHIVGQQPSVI